MRAKTHNKNNHRQVKVPGYGFSCDRDILELISLMNQMGIHTLRSCQDHNGGRGAARRVWVMIFAEALLTFLDTSAAAKATSTACTAPTQGLPTPAPNRRPTGRTTGTTAAGITLSTSTAPPAGSIRPWSVSASPAPTWARSWTGSEQNSPSWRPDEDHFVHAADFAGRGQIRAKSGGAGEVVCPTYWEARNPLNPVPGRNAGRPRHLRVPQDPRDRPGRGAPRHGGRASSTNGGGPASFARDDEPVREKGGGDV